MNSPGFFKSYSDGKISTRFRNINIVIFIIVSILIGTVMFFVLRNITDAVSKDYAKLYSANTVGRLNTYFEGEIALITKAARSSAVKDWFADEYNEEKKLTAYREMMGIIDVLSSRNLYIGIEKTRHEFTVEENFSIDEITPFATLKSDNFEDIWYFNCIASDKEYLLNVDVDKILYRKRVWLNYKVTDGSTILGALCTGLEFSDLVEELFVEYDNKSVRGLVIDEKGIIHMDSALLGDENFLHYSVGGEYHIEDQFSDPKLLSAVKEYTEAIDGYFDYESLTSVVELQGGPYRYATIAPISSTTWSVVTFYNASSLFNITKLIPLVIIMFVMLIIFIVATNFAGSKLIFVPFEKLMNSIERTKMNMNEHIYGTDREDEIGELANTVQDMKDSLIDALDKVHYDALTGIYNRRFLDENINRIIKSMSRYGGILSVIMIDVDYFKKYNDTYGHGQGDICLKTIAAALSGSIMRTDDFSARYGGEEFAVILPNTDEKSARIMADKLLQKIRECNMPHETSEISDYVTVSIGVTTANVKHTQNGDDYFKVADEALYISKQNGRNRYTFLNFAEVDMSDCEDTSNDVGQ